jgi:hypothetical protein
MENFISRAMRPVNHEDVETWFNINNMIFEKRQLFSDFTFCLFDLISETYLGDDDDSPSETRLIMNQDEKLSHFDWCWKKTIENFGKENVRFHIEGEHKDYYQTFFMDLFYNADDKVISNNIINFFKVLFDENKIFTKSDLDMMTDIYKLLNKNLI